VEDGLVTRGPYAAVRHPQFLSAIGITFFVSRLFNPAGIPFSFACRGLDANWVLFTLALWLLAILEDRELVAHFGGSYQEYAGRVPRLFPTCGRARALWRRGRAQPAAGLTAELALRLLPLVHLAGLGLCAVAGGTLLVAGYKLALRGGPLDLVRSGDWPTALCWLGSAGFVAFGLWALFRLGVRRSLLWHPADDGLVTGGPYALVRHPQYLAAVGLTLLTTRPFDLLSGSVCVLGQCYRFGSHWLPYTLLLWLLAWLEDQALAARFGAGYEAYARRVPRLFPD